MFGGQTCGDSVRHGGREHACGVVHELGALAVSADDNLGVGALRCGLQ
jgi:hypothetical protein